MAKTTVEDCYVLAVAQLARQGPLRDGARGTCHCTRDAETVRVDWAVKENTYRDKYRQYRDELLHLRYTYPRGDGSETTDSHWLFLERTWHAASGQWVWFNCPGCGERVGKLYLPPWGGRFWCRTCHRLSYLSRLYRPDPPNRVREAMAAQWMANAVELGEVSMSGAPWSMPSYEELTRPLVASPSRRPGRPSKREERERAKAERERARAEREAAQAALAKRPRGRPKVKRPYTRRKPFLVVKSTSETDAYCVKCRDRRQIPHPQPVTLANGRSALQGTCPLCGTLLTRIVKAVEEAVPATVVKRSRGRPRLERPSPRPPALPASESRSEGEGYCVKCRERREIADPQPATLANGRSALRGTCSVCDAQMIRIVAST